MNDELRARHMVRISNPDAVDLYDRLCAACEIREGGLTDADQSIVADIAYMEQTKQMLQDDIAERGVGQERYNGKQKYYQENKSVTQVRSYLEQQRKHMSELRLTPNSRKANAVPFDDDFVDF